MTQDERTQDERPKIEFPCPDYPIKIMGEADPDMHAHVLTVMQRHVSDFDVTRLTVRDSRHGRYQSITVSITATGPTQLQLIFEDLKQSPAVKLVL